MPKPIYEIRLGLIHAAVYRVKQGSGHHYTVSVTRHYRNGDIWKRSTRFGRDDIPAVRLALDKAYTWIHLETNSKGDAK